MLTLLILALVAAILCSAAIMIIGHPKQSLPPGPPRLPIVGNALDIDPRKPLWHLFTKWSQQYGDIVHVSSLGQHLIILSSASAIDDLLEKRGAIYSDRPHSVMATELSGFGNLLPFLPYGEQMRASRKIFNDIVGVRNVVKWHKLHQRSIRDCLSGFYKEPERWQSQLRMMVTKIVVKVSTGLDVVGPDDHIVQVGDRTSEAIKTTLDPGAFLVDILPVLKFIPSWFPGANFQRVAEMSRQNAIRIRDEPYEMVKAHMRKGQIVVEDSLLATFIQDNSLPDPSVEESYKVIAGIMYLAAPDTIYAAIRWFFFAMVTWPDIQRKAQDEVVTVIGSGPLPTFDDRPKLPYLEAFLKETLRWHPVAPMGVPHRLAQDDIYRAYRLPAGSTIIANTWGHNQRS